MYMHMSTSTGIYSVVWLTHTIHCSTFACQTVLNPIIQTFFAKFAIIIIFRCVYLVPF